jgi:hypothetical protein
VNWSLKMTISARASSTSRSSGTSDEKSRLVVHGERLVDVQLRATAPRSGFRQLFCWPDQGAEVQVQGPK